VRRWPVACEERDAPTRFGATHVIVSGPAGAPPVVLLRAFAATATAWRPNVEGLSRRFRVYAVDIIGQPGKSVLTRAIRGRRDPAERMCGLLGRAWHRAGLARRQFLWCLRGDESGPERVERVVMINPGGVFASFLPHILRMVSLGLLWALRPAAKRPKLTVAAMLGRNVVLGPDEQEWADLISLGMGKGTRISAVLPSVLSRHEPRANRSPVLLLVGDNDLLCEPHELLKRARGRMPSLEAEIVPGAHHIAAMARPREVNARIIRFLAPEAGLQGSVPGDVSPVRPGEPV
jgi:pimeloyl-ACP methyl ester carboxylesterase